MASHKDISDNNIVIANKFVDAFYSFNRDSLQTILSEAKDSQPNILYYQKWAECGHYEILERSKCVAKNDSVVLFPVTVKDDLMEALEIDFHVTDTFHIIVRNGKIRSVETSSNDPDTYHVAKEWVKQNRAELIDMECEGIWNGGPTPCECIQGFLKGFDDFIKRRKTTVLK
ncbi:MAG: hypothetical protein ACKVOQ_04695 [Cyclobacteriaceae bacterium]